MNIVASDPETTRRVLEGRTVVAYQGHEMALWEQGPDGLPVWDHPQVPCVQCGSVTLRFDDGTVFDLYTNLYDDHWGLLVVADVPAVDRDVEAERDAQSIYRSAALDRFPVGAITRVTVTTTASGNGHVRGICLELGDRAVTLLAGEFVEQFDGSIRLVLDDESILFFPSGDGSAWAEAQVARGNIHPVSS